MNIKSRTLRDNPWSVFQRFFDGEKSLTVEVSTQEELIDVKAYYHWIEKFGTLLKNKDFYLVLDRGVEIKSDWLQFFEKQGWRILTPEMHRVLVASGLNGYDRYTLYLNFINNLKRGWWSDINSLCTIAEATFPSSCGQIREKL